MSIGFLRGLSFGIIIVTSIFTFFLNPFKEQSNAIEQKELSDAAVAAHIEKKGQTVITLEDFNQLKQKENDLIDLEAEIKQLEESIAQLKNEKNTDTSPPVEEETTTKNYVLEIKKGMNSSDVIEKLVEANIIENPTEFEQYLRTRNLEGSIQIGTFELNSGMTLDEIAKSITKKG